MSKPEPLTRDPGAHQKLWSPKKGTTVVGQEASRPAAVVPAPPWCMTAWQRGKSQSWGTASTSSTSSGGSSPCACMLGVCQTAQAIKRVG